MINIPTRRKLLSVGLIGATSALLPGLSMAEIPLAPTPECHDDDVATLAETEGPFFKPSSPERAVLSEAGMAGHPLELSGFVLTRDCKPVAGALMDFWQADDKGEYDNSGFRLRGHQFTDAVGRYRLRTIVPAAYETRTRHIHVKVLPPTGKLLTTQIYFPDEPKNHSDFLFRDELLMHAVQTDAALSGRFDFLLEMPS